MAPWSSRWSRSPGTLWRVAPGFLALVDLEGRRLQVAGPAGDMWELLSEPRSEDDLVEMLAARYDVSSQSIADEVSHLLLSLRERGFAVLVERASAQ